MMKMTRKQMKAIRSKRAQSVYRDAGERFQIQRAVFDAADADVPVSEFVQMVRMLGSMR